MKTHALFRSLFRWLAAAALAALMFPAHAQEAQQDTQQDPAVAAAAAVNTALVQCVTAMTTGAASAAEAVRPLLIAQAPATCRQMVVMPVVQAKPDNVGRLAQFGLGLAQIWAGYKGQSLMWGGVAALAGRGFDAAENLGSQGIEAAAKDPQVFITGTSGTSELLYPGQ